jgi:hypothetical protein
MGQWLFVPGRPDASRGEANPYLERPGERVPLHYCSPILADLVRTVGRIEAEFTSRCGAEPIRFGR